SPHLYTLSLHDALPILRRPEVLAANLGDLPVPERVVLRAAADSSIGLEDDHRLASLDQSPRRRETREPGADDRDIDLSSLQPPRSEEHTSELQSLAYLV